MTLTELVESLDPIKSLRHLSNDVGADGLLPLSFLLLIKEQVACMTRPLETLDNKGLFLYDI